MASLIVSRTLCYYGFFRTMKLWVDGKHVGDLPRRPEQTFELPDGPHRIEVSMDWCRSPVRIVTLSANAPTRILARTAFFPIALLATFVWPSKVFSVSEESLPC